MTLYDKVTAWKVLWARLSIKYFDELYTLYEFFKFCKVFQNICRWIRLTYIISFYQPSVKHCLDFQFKAAFCISQKVKKIGRAYTEKTDVVEYMGH